MRSRIPLAALLLLGGVTLTTPAYAFTDQNGVDWLLFARSKIHLEQSKDCLLPPGGGADPFALPSNTFECTIIRGNIAVNNLKGQGGAEGLLKIGAHNIITTFPNQRTAIAGADTTQFGSFS